MRTLALLLLALPATSQSLLRAPHYELPVDHTFEHLADLDQDGKMDAVVRSSSGWYSVSSVGNNPITGQPIPLIEDHERSVLGDVNGDGFPDLCVQHRLGTTAPTHGVQFLEGKGDGSFRPPVLLPSPQLLDALILADVDGNGVDDLVVVNVDLNLSVGYVYSADVWYLDGPAPVPAVSLTMPGAVGRGARIDVDGDGRDEVVLSRYAWEPGTTDLYVASWDATGAPVGYLPMDVTTAFGSFASLQVGDVDGDGDEDLVAFEIAAGTGSARVMENVAGSLVAGPLQTNLGGLPYFRDIPLADWDNDGDDDVIYVNRTPSFNPSNLVYFLETTGTNLDVAAFFYVPGQSPLLGIGGIEDLNGDGFLDVAAGNTIFLGRGVFEGVPQSYITSGCCGGARLAEDLDGDGDVDLWPGSGSAWFNDGTGSGEITPLYPTDLVFPDTDLEAVFSRGDFDGDGHVDHLAEFGYYTVPSPFVDFVFLGTRLVRGQADGTFVDGGYAKQAGGVGASSRNAYNAVDLDGDGDLDVLGTNGWYPNDGSGVFGALIPGYAGNPGATFDHDGDGDVDLLFRSSVIASSSWSIHSNDGAGNFTSVLTFTMSGDVGDEPLVHDLDGDGLQDVCFTVNWLPADSGVAWARNLGGGVFAPPVIRLQDDDAYDVLAVGDVDGDGVQDLMATKQPTSGITAKVDLWLATPGSGGGPTTYTKDSYFGTPLHALADLDGDGDDDLVGSHRIEALANDGPSAGSIRQYGFGYAGGLTPPLLGAQGPFTPGSQDAELRISHGIGGSSYFVFFGFNEVALLDVPLPGAGVFVAPLYLIYSGQLGGTPGALGEGSVAIDKTPWTLAIPGLSIPQQALVVHPGYPDGYALTNAVTLGYGL